MKNKLIIFSLVLAFLGFLDAAYLTIAHYKNLTPPCTLHGCEAVLTSSFSMLGPVPVALFGALFYLGMIVLCFLILVEGVKQVLKLFYLGAVWGVLFSVYLFAIQWLIIKSFCQYCLLSEVVAMGLLILAVLKFREERKTN